jgi:cytoskeletal protein CcmA (bactofilin family)
MSLWKDLTTNEAESARRETPGATREAVVVARDLHPKPAERAADAHASSADQARRARERADSGKEALISAGLTIEGKIQGAGHVRIAGNFNGDVQVDGNLTIEPGARVTGQVRAQNVVVGGELEGNIEGASRVELLETGMLSGDLKAGALIVAAGSRMRGRVEFGWDAKTDKPQKLRETGSGT